MDITLINKFEKEFGKPLRYISKDNFVKILKEKHLLKKYFTNFSNSKMILDFLDQNSNLKEYSRILRLTVELVKTEKNIDDIFSRYIEDKNREKLISSIKELLTSDNSLVVVSTILVALISLEDQDLSIYYNSALENSKKLFDIINNIHISEDSYSLICNLIDLLYQMKFLWENIYESEIKIDIESYMDRLHNFEDQVFKAGQISPVDIRPEELGFIDISKLK